MADQDQTKGGSTATSAAQQAPGGRSSRGPEYGTGGEPQVPVPPYDELRGEPGENTAPQAFDAANAPEPGPEPPVSDEERRGMSAADVDPEPPLGVGVSRGGRAEDLAPDRDEPTTGAGRPVGRAAEDDSEGVHSQGATDPRAPDLQGGDQGG
ncbi:MAG TPA: hypothetical protein VNP92_27060 [Actinophytocola sp.]|nr:hypothetical protein [Actinophytocola sp.]